MTVFPVYLYAAAVGGVGGDGHDHLMVVHYAAFDVTFPQQKALGYAVYVGYKDVLGGNFQTSTAAAAAAAATSPLSSTRQLT